MTTTNGVGRVVTAGETMVLVVPPGPGRLRHAGSVTLSIGGAESNVAIGLSRLGVPASWVSALGEDELGELVLHRVRAEGVDTSAVRRVPDRPTGLYLREEVAGALRVYYYRSGSAASTLAPGAFDPAVLDGATFLHLTGITGALSPESAEFLTWAAQSARAAGVRVSYDVNYRSRLWEPAAARAATEALLPYVDVLLVGDDEARALWGRGDDTCLDPFADGGPPADGQRHGRLLRPEPGRLRGPAQPPRADRLPRPDRRPREMTMQTADPATLLEG